MLWLILALVILPFLHFNTEIMPIQSAYILGVIVLGISITGAKVFQKNKFLGVGCFCVLASYLITRNTPGVRSAFQTLVFFLIWTVFYLQARESKSKPLLWAIAIAGAVNAEYIMFQTLGFDPVFSNMNPSEPVFGFLGSPGDSGVFQAIALPIALKIHPLLGLWTFLGLLLCKSTVSIVAGVVGACFCLKREYRKYLFVVPVILAILIMFVDKPKKVDFETRLANVYHTLKFIKQGKMTAYDLVITKEITFSTREIKYTPLGYGLGSYKMTVPFIPQNRVDNMFNYVNSRSQHPHNSYVWILYEMGPISVVVLLLIIAWVLWRGKSQAVKGSILSAAVCGLGYFPLLVIPVTLQLAAILGINDGNDRR